MPGGFVPGGFVPRPLPKAASCPDPRRLRAQTRAQDGFGPKTAGGFAPSKFFRSDGGWGFLARRLSLRPFRQLHFSPRLRPGKIIT